MVVKQLVKKLGTGTCLIIFAAQIVAAQDSTRKTTVAKQKTITKPVTAKPAGSYAAKPYQAKSYQARPAGAISKVASPAPNVTAPVANQYTAVQPAPTDRSINGQYQYLLTKLYGYQRPMAAAFYKSITDSLRAEKKKLPLLQNNVNQLTDTVKQLHTQLNAQQTELNESSSKVDNINLLGIGMTKSSYNMLMWGLVIIFGAVAAFVVARSGSHSREASYRTKLYNDLEEEHKAYKVKANEKEKKLARELQTARNKLEELTGKPDY